jgi:protease-4
MAKKGLEKQSFIRRISIGRIVSILLTLILIFVLISFFGLIAALVVGPQPSGNIAVIHIKGIIRADGYGSSTSAIETVELIRKAEENEEVKAILLDINSGGGSAVGSDEIAQAVKAAEKPTVAVIREAGASGAYWVASAADKIYANRMSITGSIGVIAAYLEFARLIEDYNITYRRLVSGQYKDMGSPFKELTGEEEQKFQQMIDRIRNYFVDAVAENRGMTRAEIENIATGEIMLGVEAKSIGLVDELGTRQDAVDYIEKELNITAELADYKPKPTLRDMFSAFAGRKVEIAGISEENSVRMQT